MPRRKEPLVTGEIYHVFNRGVEKRPIFENARHYQRFLDLLPFYTRSHHLKFSTLSGKEREEVISKKTGEKLVEILCYCLMPNHFHLMLKQSSDHGIKNFMRIVADSYSHYFNITKERVGPLFQGKFKAVRIEDDAQLLHVSRYIHLNPVVTELVKEPEDYDWSSYLEYIAKKKGFSITEIILDQFKSITFYKNFVHDYADYAKRLHKIEHLLLE